MERAVWFSAGLATCGLGIFLFSRFNRSPHSTVALAEAEALLAQNPNAVLETTASNKGNDAQELIEEQFSRNVQFLGEERHEKFANSFVVVVGLGGVGSHAAHMLVRSGLRKIRLIDFDQVTLSSLNRHAVAGREDVGTSKVEVLAMHLRRFAPDCQVDVRVAMFEEAAAEELLEGDPDYIVDAIDDMKTKMDLLEYCGTRNIPVLSSMSAGARSDPTRLHIGRLTDVTYDPMASRLRWLIKKRNIDPENVHVVYSSEKPVVKLLPLDKEQAEQPEAFGAVPHFRLRVIPVIGMMPAIFGMTMATFVCLRLAGVPFNPMSVPQMSQSAVHKVQQKLTMRMRKVYKLANADILVNEDDMAFLVVHFRQRCALSAARMGTQGMKAVVTKWRFDRPCTLDNLVLVHEPFAKKLDELGINKELPSANALGVDQTVIETVTRKLEEISLYSQD